MRRLWRAMPLRLRSVTQHGGVILGLGGILVLWAGVLHSLSAEREQALRGAVQNVSNLSRAFEENTIRSIKTVDQTLRYVRDSYARNSTDFDLLAWVKDTQALTDLTFQISLIDKDGMLIGSNLSSTGERMDLSDREHFRFQRDNPGDQLFISKPILGRASNKWSIQMTRKIIAADGSFGGVVVVSMDPQYLSRFYDSVDLGAKGVVTLVGEDGVVRARGASGNTDLRQTLTSSHILSEYARAKSGTLEVVSKDDGVMRLYAYRGVRSYPLIVAIGIAEDEFMTDYERNRRSYIFLASVLTGLLLVVTVVIARHQAGLRRTREKLRASEALYAQKSRLLEAALENMSQGIMMVDANRRVQICNHRAVAKLGLPEELMANHPLFDDVLRWQWQQGEFGTEGGDVETWLRGFVLTGGISDEAQTYERARPDGRVLEIRSTPLQGGGVVRTYTDITERKEAETVLRAARDEADRAARAKSEFLAMMSHEIRSPMNGLLGIIELLRDSKLEADQMHMVELVHKSAATLLGILNDVLDFSKIEAGAVALSPGPTAVRDLVRVLVEPTAVAAAKKGVQLLYDVSDDVPDWISVDALRLRQVLGNLVGNAVKFTAAGTVELAVFCATLPAGSPAMKFAIRDSGIGMAPEVVQRLFEPFVQADASTTKTFGGTGLGLSISRRLARILGGDIAVTSEQGRGSIFTLTIPLIVSVPGEDVEDSPEANIDTGGLQGLRVLVAEDQETNRWLIKRQFARFGIEIEVVEDGREALAALAEVKFDLLVTDCHMPVMDGIELARSIRAAEAEDGRARLPILGLTADVTAAMRERCHAAGMDDIAAKPINLRRLDEALRRIMARQNNADVAAPAEPSPAADALFDDGTYRELFADAEDEGKEWLDGYLEAATSMTVSLRDNIGSDDRAAVMANAHRLAGSSLSAGAMRLGTLGRALEHAALQATPSELQDFETRIIAMLDATSDAIQRFLMTKTELVP